MCGFAGFLTADASILGSLEAIPTEVARAIEHRGPDDSGTWVDVQADIALGFRLLSIIGLSSAGHQPMAYSGGRSQITSRRTLANQKNAIKSTGPRTSAGKGSSR